MDCNLIMKILLIGAGELGSRHLQGVLKAGIVAEVFVLDPFIASLEKARERANEVKHSMNVSYVTALTDVPKSIDLAIIATNADVREKVTCDLLKEHTVKRLILEKVLFQNVEAFERIGALLQEKSVPTWVNHPRRMFAEYKVIRDEFLSLNERCTVAISGGDWGLGCNGLHFLDLISFVTGDDIKSLDASLVDKTLQMSKRMGVVEFTGTLTGLTDAGHAFMISSFLGKSAPVTITICTPSVRWIIQEGGISQTIRMKADNNFKAQLGTFEMRYQSSLTTDLVDTSAQLQDFDLPNYTEASKIHKLFVDTFLGKYNEITGNSSFICPIT